MPPQVGYVAFQAGRALSRWFDSGRDNVATASRTRANASRPGRVGGRRPRSRRGRDLVDGIQTDIAQKCMLRTRSCTVQQLLSSVTLEILLAFQRCALRLIWCRNEGAV
jgi:hypothetical protein